MPSRRSKGPSNVLALRRVCERRSMNGYLAVVGAEFLDQPTWRKTEVGPGRWLVPERWNTKPRDHQLEAGGQIEVQESTSRSRHEGMLIPPLLYW